MPSEPKTYLHQDDDAESAYTTLAMFGICIIPADIGFCAVAYWTYSVLTTNGVCLSNKVYDTRYAALRGALLEVLPLDRTKEVS
jgi:hypothetical protein